MIIDEELGGMVMEAEKRLRVFIGSKSIDESNTFFRKLWGLLDQVRTNAWCYTPFRNPGEKVVYIGSNNIGTFWFDYEKCGCIQNLYISNCKIEEEKMIEIVEKAKEYNCPLEYRIEYDFDHDDGIKMANQCFDDVYVKEEDNKTVIGIQITAYSELDLKYWSYQKQVAIKYMLFIFSGRFFRPIRIGYAENKHCEKIAPESYNYEWFDTDECPQNTNNEYYLPIEFFKIVRDISELSFYDDFITSMINASQMLYNSKALLFTDYGNSKARIEQTGLIDMINTNIVSSLEAIVSSSEYKPQKCKTCGQDVFKIGKRVYELAEEYLGTPIATIIKNEIYTNRSKYLHEGKTDTPLYYYGTSYPLIDPSNAKKMLMPQTGMELNLIDYCNYIIRKKIKEHYFD